MSVLLLGVGAARAQNGGQVTALGILDGSIHQISPDSSVTVMDSAFFNPANIGKIDSTYGVQNQVTLMINEASTLYFRTAFSVTVKLRIYYTDSHGASDSTDRSFTVNYDSVGTYNSRSTFAFNGAHQVTIKVLSDSSNVTTWNPISVLLIQNQLTTTPGFLFSCSNTVTNITVSTPSDTADELPITWTPVTGANQYDLEWTWVDSSALDTTQGIKRFGSPYSPTLIFQNSSTRVTTTGTSYNIPIIYDNTGTVFIRVRPVQTTPNSYTVTNAIWSSDASPSEMGQYTFRGHERPLNWQSNISFAEEGKRKVVVQYFDGSLRSRQTVTKDNTTNTTIVAETYYDYQGRPAIQVMPSPTLKTVIRYTAGFNTAHGSADYNQSNFDSLPASGSTCSIHADSMSSVGGASEYYSPHNPQAYLGMNQFIPNAHGYPFTETEFMPDNTGRIERQGGVDSIFQLGIGHETKYYYGTPDQNELDALFGTEVGDKSHYFKNMVRDANGQYSVNYVDMHGRTIATALAGAAPSGMTPLSSYNRATITETLADSNSVAIRGQSMVSQKSLLVPMKDTFTFNYNLLPDVYNDTNCREQNVCYTCRYDLTITIAMDTCDSQPAGSQVYTVSRQNFSLTTLGNSCNNPLDTVSLTLVLPEGSYTITKTLTVDPNAYDFYRDSIYLPGNTCTSISQFISQQKAVAVSANSNCAPSCAACLTSIGTEASFLANYNAAIGLGPTDTTYKTEADAAFMAAQSTCSSLCQTTTAYNDILSAMLQDMSPPYGQYADSGKSAASDRYSIFYIPPADSSNYIPLYKLPQVVYEDINGKPDSVYDAASGLTVVPNELSPTEFDQNFRPSWATALLPYHPEYCKLQVLQANNNSLLYDRKMESILTFQEAHDSGFLNPTGIDTLSSQFPIVALNTDPLAATLGSQLNTMLIDYQKIGNPNVTKSLWEMACIMVKCDSGDVGCLLRYDEASTTFNASDMCPGDLDMAWRNFREMYLGAKQNIFYQNLLSDNAINKPGVCSPANNRVYNTEPRLSSLYGAHHQPEFSDIGTSLTYSALNNYQSVSGSTQAGSEQAMGQASIDSFYSENCHAYASQWLQDMSACTVYDTSDVNNILIPGLYALCRQACDSGHPYGASTLPPGQTIVVEGETCTSFQDIINHYNVANGITDTLDCNAEVITAPLPYGSQPVYSNEAIYSRPSDCECSLINTLYSMYTVAGFGDPSFSAWLLRTHNIIMADSNLTTLRSMCSNTTGTATCTYLSNPIQLPPAMQCYSGSTCSSCQAIDSLYTMYKTTYPRDTPSITSDSDTAQVQKNILFQNFMNNRLGYNLQAWQYIQFMDTCAVHSADTATTQSCTPTTIAQTFSSGTGSTDNMISIASTPDGGYALAGFKGSSASGATDTAYLMRYDSIGNIQWAKTFAIAGGSNFWRVRATTDGGFVAAGAANQNSVGGVQGASFVVKTDGAGNVLWQKQLAFTGTVRSDQAFDIVQTHDGGYALTGDHNIGGNHSGPASILCIKLDSLGNFVWGQSFDSTSGDGYAIGEYNDTVVVLGRQWSAPFGGVQGVMLKLNETNGSQYSSIVIQDSTLAPGSMDYYGLQAFNFSTTATGYHFGDYVSEDGDGNSGRYGFIDIGFDGRLQRARRIGLPPGNTIYDIEVGNIVPLSDGGWLAGETTGTTTHISWLRLDSLGNALWSRESMFPGSQLLGAVIQNPDSTFTGLGTDGGVAMVLSLSSTGSAGCYDSLISITDTLPRIGLVPVVQPASSLTESGSSSSVAAISVGINANAITCAGSGNCYTVYNGPTLCGKASPLLPPVTDSLTVCTDTTFFGETTGTALYNTYSDSLTGAFEQNYLKVCMNAYKHESFTVTHHESEYHYTLYYYDQAGNLLKTVPPAGVADSNYSSWFTEVAAARAAGTVLVPSHTLVTNYRYNSLNDVVAQQSPDGGATDFWYDLLGRLVLSENSKQRPNNQYNYTKYDSINRITQVGQLVSTTPITDTISRNDSTLLVWENDAMPSADQITVTSYDTAAYAIIPEMSAINLRNRIAWTALYNQAADLLSGADNHAAATYYSYDILGDVDTLVQDFKFGSMANSGNRFKKTVYNFDISSSKVNQVTYQHGFADAFYHNYFYDAENRITNVLSSTDSVKWDNDAFYSYYPHGLLARTVLGQQQVQGINYAYTLQGWLKAINPTPDTAGSFTLRPDSSNNIVANTAYNLLLDYFSGGYNPISMAGGPDSAVSTTLGSDYRPLYNGNISSMGARIRGLNNPLLYAYQYDQLNRLIHMDAWNRTGTTWSAITIVQDFQENVAYDPNGNIRKYKRNGNNTFAGEPLAMDSLNYCYIPGTNRLDHITDSVPTAYPGYNDLTNQSASNYQYDSIGELTADAASNISGITWTVYGKIASITKASDTTILFTYDPAGNRISKSVVYAGDTLTTWYVRDAQGNILSIYTYGDPSVNGKDLTQTELDIYGAGRVGIWKRNVNVASITPATTDSIPLLGLGDSIIFTRGNKLFELTNHLGNILSTISDKRYGVSTDDSTVIYFNPEVVSANDYYPFGSLEPNRTYEEANSVDYRYGFNGKENDNEVKGVGDQLDYGMRSYDPRVGRFMSVDAFTSYYPNWTPYQFAGNSPVWAKDIDGNESDRPTDPANTQNNTGSDDQGGKNNDQSTLPAVVVTGKKVNKQPNEPQTHKYVVLPGPIQHRQSIGFEYSGTAYTSLSNKNQTFRYSQQDYQNMNLGLGIIPTDLGLGKKNGTIDEPAADFVLYYSRVTGNFVDKYGFTWYHMKPDAFDNVFLQNGYTLIGGFFGIERGLFSYNKLIRISGRASIAAGPMLSKPTNNTTMLPLYGYDGKYQVAGWGSTASFGVTLQVINAISLIFSYSVHGSITNSFKATPTDTGHSETILAGSPSWGVKVNISLTKQ